MPREHPHELRARAVPVVRSGQLVTKTAEDLGIKDSCVYALVNQDRMDRGELTEVSRAESRALPKAKRRIRELPNEVEIVRRSNALLGSSTQHPKGSTR